MDFASGLSAAAFTALGDDADSESTDDMPSDGGDDVNGIVALAEDLEEGMGTEGNDVLALEWTGGADDSVDAGAGDDHIHLTGGTAIGGAGDDTITAHYSLSQEILDEYAVAAGGEGDDLLQTSPNAGADLAIFDGGEGDDTVALHGRFAGDDIQVTLGEGADVLKQTSTEAPSDPLAEILDFNPDEDRIEIIREGTEFAQPEPFPALMSALCRAPGMIRRRFWCRCKCQTPMRRQRSMNF